MADLSLRLLKGEIALGPTETVMGLLALPALSSRINTLKKSNDKKPLIHLIGKLEDAYDLWAPEGLKVAEPLLKCWPAPLTIIAPEKKTGQGLALRMPSHPELLALLKLTGPLVSSSANITGKPVCESVDDADPELLKDLDFLIDESCPDKNSPPSTLVEIDVATSKVTLLRAGAFSKERLISIVPKLQH